MLLHARVVLPISSPPIENGAVLISANRIVAVGRWDDLSARTTEKPIDLGETILLPGLINSHCHLDYTDLAGMLPPPKNFPDWIKSLLALKAGWSYTDFAKSWVNGAAMLARTGTTTVADIEAVPELLPDAWSSTPLRIFSFLEMTGVKSRRAPHEILQEAFQKIESLATTRARVGLSPHALYSTTPELLRLSAEKCREKNRHVTMHVAESAEEFEMYLHQRGSLFDWLKSQRDMSDCGAGSPVQRAQEYGLLGENFLGVHVNYLAPGDVEILAKIKSSVVHCPHSHAYFAHQKFPFAELAAAGVNLGLGTDSLASTLKIRGKIPELNLFSEMQQFASTAPGVSPEIILQMATLNGARALGWQKQIGELCENSLADLIAIPFAGNFSAATDAILQHSGDVAASMIDGQWAIAPG